MHHDEVDSILSSSSSTNRWRKRPPLQASHHGGGSGIGGVGNGRSPGTAGADRRHQLVVPEHHGGSQASTPRAGAVMPSMAASFSSSTSSANFTPRSDGRKMTDASNSGYYGGGGDSGGGGGASDHLQRQQPHEPVHQSYYLAASSQASWGGGEGAGGHHPYSQQPPYDPVSDRHLPAAARPSPRMRNATWGEEPGAYLLSPPHAMAAAASATVPAVVTAAGTHPGRGSMSALPAPVFMQQHQQQQEAYGTQSPSLPLPHSSQMSGGAGRRRQGRGGQGAASGVAPSSSQHFDAQLKQEHQQLQHYQQQQHQQQQQQEQQQEQPQQQPQHQHPQPSSAGAARTASGASAGSIATLILAYLLTYALYHASVEALAGQRTRLSFPVYPLPRPSGSSSAYVGGSPGAGAGAVVTAGAATAADDNAALLEERDHHHRNVNDSGVGLKIEDHYYHVPPAVSWGGAGGGGSGPGEAGGPGGGGGAGWGKGVSVVTVSAWQSLAALGIGFLLSKFWRRFRRSEGRALSDVERTRRNRCLLVFAAAHLAGTGLEYHGYGVIGPAAAEVLRSTEAACFCLLSLNVGMQRPGLASVPTLLLALGLALTATPTAGDLRAGWGGLRASLAASMLLAIRAIAAKMALDDYGLDEISALFSAAKMTAGLQFVILLAVEVPRAALGQPPRLLHHLWGVGVMEVDHQSDVVTAVGGGGEGGVGIGVGDAGDWGEGRERARLALLLLANGVCLYGHVLVLFALLSRLSATMFAISSGYVRASLVFVLLLSLQGSAAGTRSVGMALATLAVSAHFYRAYARSRVTSSLLPAGDNVGGPLCDADDGGEGGGGSGDAGVVTGTMPFPPPPLADRRLPRFRGRESDIEGLPPQSMSASSCSGSSSMGTVDGGIGVKGGLGPVASPAGAGHRGSAGDWKETRGGRGGARGGGSPGLFIPLLGTKLEPTRGRKSMHGDGSGGGGGGGGGDTGSIAVDGPDGDHDRNAVPGASGEGASATSPSRFAWRWMGLRPVEAATAEAPSPASPARSSQRLSSHTHHRQQQQQQPGADGGGSSRAAGGRFGLSRFSASSRQSDHHGRVLSPPPALGAVIATNAPAPARPSSPDECRDGAPSFRHPLGSGGSHDPAANYEISSTDSSPSSTTQSGPAEFAPHLRSSPEFSLRSPPGSPPPHFLAVATGADPHSILRDARVTRTTETAEARVASDAGVATAVAPRSRRGGGGSGRILPVTATAGVPRPRRIGHGALVPAEEGPAPRSSGGAGGFGFGEVGSQESDAAIVGQAGAGRSEGGRAGGVAVVGGVRALGAGINQSSPTSSSSFSLNGFEVIDKDEDMWT